VLANRNGNRLAAERSRTNRVDMRHNVENRMPVDYIFACRCRDIMPLNEGDLIINLQVNVYNNRISHLSGTQVVYA
jgi:hypothetical protein